MDQNKDSNPEEVEGKIKLIEVAWAKTKSLDKAAAFLAILAGTLSLVSSFSGSGVEEILSDFFRGLTNLFSSPANASTGAIGVSQPQNPDWYKPVLMGGVYLTLFGCLYFAIFSGKSKAETEKAWDLIKFIAGFFIGTLAG
ncbi:hypothetical protein [Qipengyuania flava]|uniref:hypothetical protein n=1 Tax=Qipengyuania flava TaxID=192812 RepID=UPI001C63A0B6|nr:hypothetical protein [Qipengyuania flava]QYJ06498.1 hypothetical protein KUV82_10515 [Qipengyuania flava]